MTHKSVLLDTSFFLRFLNEADPLFNNADGYYRHFLQNGFPLVLSTIAISEYCVKGKSDELPLKNLRILPFNLLHAERAGEFARFVFESKGILQLSNRKVIPNDTKLFAQADVETDISYYLSSDVESKKIYDLLTGTTAKPAFQFLNLAIPCETAFGRLF